MLSPVRAQRVLCLFALLSVVGLTGCYEARWAEAGKRPMSATGIDGRWQGSWKSDANGHSGGLRCIVTPIDSSHFKADFRATYGWIFSFGYSMTMDIRASDSSTQPSVVYFSGKENLGWLAGGEYTYVGKADTLTFFCNYKSGGDQGTFQMVRPGGVPTKE